MIGNYIEQGRQSLLKRDIQKIRGTETGTVVSMNRRYIDSIMLEMRMIDAVPDPDTTCSFLGRKFATPVMSGALSGLDNIRPHGMAVLARGMADADACMWAGIGQETELREILATGVPTVKIIKPYKDHDKIFEKIDMAQREGCFAIGMDTSFFYGSQVGEKVIASNIVSPKSAEELKSFIEYSKLPFILKGILSERDADKALNIGASAIVVSHHSGSVMDYAVPPMMILPRIAKLVNNAIPILIDGDIKRGSDVFKALALGADAVLVGRALMAGMELDGSEGVTKVVKGITEELRRIMGQTGCTSLKDIDPSILWVDL